MVKQIVKAQGHLVKVEGSCTYIVYINERNHNV